MTEKVPNQEVLKAFNISGKPILPPGGEGMCYRVGNVVLKPIRDTRESSWIAEINNNLESNEFRVPKPIRTKNKEWFFNNWTASNFLKGKHKPKHYTEAIKLSIIFHKTLKPKP